jgi:hypothetical protein
MSDRDVLLTRFLLGESTERERAEVEDRLLSDEGFYERTIAAEDDLMDAYVRGELPASERERFEKAFLSTAPRRERVEFARGLAESATRLHEAGSVGPRSALAPVGSSHRKGFLAALFPSRPALSYALAAAAITVVAVGVWLAVDRMRAGVEPQQARTEDVAPHKPEQRPLQDDRSSVPPQPKKEADGSLTQEPGNVIPEAARTPERESKRKPPTRPVFATITLAPGSLRDGSAAGSLVIPRGATQVRLRLQLDGDDYQTYHAVVSTPEGRRIWAGSARKERQKNAHSVVITPPAASLQRGDYVVELSGAVAGSRSEPAAAYSFRVIRED